MTLEQFQSELSKLPNKWIAETQKHEFYCYPENTSRDIGWIIKGGSAMNWNFEKILEGCRNYDFEKIKGIFK